MTDRNNRDEKTSPIYGSLAQGGQFYRRPGARLSEPQDESVINLSTGVSDSRHEGFHAFDKAHAVMLTEEGLIPSEKGAAILRGIRQMEEEGHVEVRRKSGRSAHAGEAYLISEFGEGIGGWLHLARSSHDLASVSRRLVLRERLLAAMDAALDLMMAYTDRAAEQTHAVIPTYTGLQHAQVATIGFCLMSFERPLERDFERLLSAYDRVNTSPAGAAVGTTSHFQINRKRVADLLGFEDLHNNAEDVDKSYDVILECGSVFATMLANVALAADQILVWYSKEFSLLDIPDRFAGTSSIMPQKKNPHTIESVQRDTNDVIGEVMQAFAATKNVGGGVQISTSVLDQSIDNLKTWNELISEIEFNADRGEELVYADWSLATDIAGMVVQEANIPWRTAHQITAILVRHAHEEGFRVTDLTTDHLDRAAEEYLGGSIDIPQSAIDEVVDAEHAIESRSLVPGSPAPSQVENQISAAREFIVEGRKTVSERREAVSAASRRLETAIDEIVSQDD
ncbi:lyase family protein [Haladaptatus sp. NG-SE-30]